ncbi:hypothetical protein CTAYLR_010424 [Chrysophaeum taylorii]|uniref:Uncharacterized protein n=1 Tax=Chrysophaeum taylorii TaxID=2483200 RepID=A0AAD7UAS1_9STRA|nr:hypothetical protein CTAYLR_010424 [Chrysophaeum taylorii]
MRCCFVFVTSCVVVVRALLSGVPPPAACRPHPCWQPLRAKYSDPPKWWQRQGFIEVYNRTTIASLYDKPKSSAGIGSYLRDRTDHDKVTVRRRDGRILPIPQQKRYRSREWVRNLIGIPSSKTLRRIRNPVLGLTVWSGLVALGCQHVEFVDLTFIHAITGSTLGLLLTFRTNAAYTRFWEGRTIWQNVVDRCRDLARLSAAYADALGAARYRRVCALLSRFPLMLEYHLEGRKSSKEPAAVSLIEEVVLDRTTSRPLRFHQLPKHQRQLARHYATKSRLGRNGQSSDNLVVLQEETNTDDDLLLSTDIDPRESVRDTPRRNDVFEKRLRECANRPLFVANALVAELREVPDSDDGFFTNRERFGMIEKVNALATSIAACERLVQTPVPLSYARHTSRFLSLWCLSLPFAIAPAFGPVLTPLVMALVSWGLFGIQEIGLWIEDPFRGLLKLGVISDTIICDVRETAMYFTHPAYDPALSHYQQEHRYAGVDAGAVPIFEDPPYHNSVVTDDHR